MTLARVVSDTEELYKDLQKKTARSHSEEEEEDGRLFEMFKPHGLT